MKTKILWRISECILILLCMVMAFAFGIGFAIGLIAIPCFEAASVLEKLTWSGCCLLFCSVIWLVAKWLAAYLPEYIKATFLAGSYGVCLITALHFSFIFGSTGFRDMDCLWTIAAVLVTLGITLYLDKCHFKSSF